MAAEVGPQIRMPWFQGKPEEKRYFRELERLKVIYTCDEPKTLNMALHGLRGRADDWAHSLLPGEKDTFAHLKAAMSKIFVDRWAVWQKHTDFFALRQGKDQTVLDFAGTIKRHSGKADVRPGTVLAVFLEGLKGSIAKQVAIQDPKTFDEAVATATRLESLDRAKPTKVSLNVMGSEHEREEDPKDAMVGVVEKLGVVLARIESAPWNRNPNLAKDQQSRQGTKGTSQAESSTQRGQEGTKGNAKAKNTGPVYRDAGKGPEPDKKEDYPDKFCIAHQTYGHSTDPLPNLKTYRLPQPMRVKGK